MTCLTTIARECCEEVFARVFSGQTETVPVEPCVDIIQKHIDRAIAEVTTMQEHTLKCWPPAFQGIWDGTKRHDYRRNDRDFRVGDELVHMEWDPGTEEYTGRQCRSRVTYISTDTDPWGIPEGYCVMSLSDPYGRTG